MNNLQIITNPEVESVFDNYPDGIREKLLNLRRLIIESAQETEGIDQLEETLKWGEPSYLTKIGSTIRIGWKAKKPDQYAMYFKCTSQLVHTFKSVYPNVFTYESNRAIVFGVNDDVSENELKKSIVSALRYHKVKKDPLLGIRK